MEKKHWSKMVWAKFNTPKHSFMIWLAVQDRLKTRERLKNIGVIDITNFMLCGNQDETNNHLYFELYFE